MNVNNNFDNGIQNFGNIADLFVKMFAETKRMEACAITDQVIDKEFLKLFDTEMFTMINDTNLLEKPFNQMQPSTEMAQVMQMLKMAVETLQCTAVQLKKVMVSMEETDPVEQLMELFNHNAPQSASNSPTPNHPKGIDETNLRSLSSSEQLPEVLKSFEQILGFLQQSLKTQAF